MSARVTAGIVGTAALAALVGIGIATQDRPLPAASVERIQGAVSLLRARGGRDEDIAARLAAKLDITLGEALAQVKQSYGPAGRRDPGSLRSVELHMYALAADVPAAEAAVGVAWCAPLEGLGEQAQCVRDQQGWFAGALCDEAGAVRARWAALRATPTEARRLRAAAASGRFDVRDVDRAGFERLVGARGFHICSPTE